MRKSLGCLLITTLACLVLIACQGSPAPGPVREEALPTLTLESSAFAEGGMIPVQYTCDGQDLSPPLAWSEPPDGTVSLALIADDPDAPMGTWIHWVVYDLPAAVRSLPEGVPAEEQIAGGGVQGANSWKRLGYGGPCPPKGSEHRYFFKLYALDIALGLKPGASQAEVQKAIQGHVLAEGQIVGRYGR